MPKLTEADKVEIRRLYGNGVDKSFADIGKMFNRHATTIMRIVKTCDATAGDTLPSKKRARGASERNVVAQRPAPLAVVREEPRTEALVEGAHVEAQGIMRELKTLYDNEVARFQELEAAERDYKAGINDDALRNALSRRRYKKDFKELSKDERQVVDTALPGAKFDVLMDLYAKMSMAMLGMKGTLAQMGRLTTTLQITVDARTQTINITVDEAESKVIEEIWPKLCQTCKDALCQDGTHKNDGG